MRIRRLKCYNGILSTLLVALGFESCNNIIEGEDEYGCPVTKYLLKGTVTDTDGKPIKGLKVARKWIVDNQPAVGVDSVSTDEGGAFRFSESDVYYEEGMNLVIEDVDGAENGEFINDTVSISRLPKKKVEEGHGWYNGKYEINGDRVLKRK